MVTSTGGLIVRTGRGAVTLRGTVAAGGLVIGVATCSVAACQRYSASEATDVLTTPSAKPVDANAASSLWASAANVACADAPFATGAAWATVVTAAFVSTLRRSWSEIYGQSNNESTDAPSGVDTTQGLPTDASPTGPLSADSVSKRNPVEKASHVAPGFVRSSATSCDLHKSFTNGSTTENGKHGRVCSAKPKSSRGDSRPKTSAPRRRIRLALSPASTSTPSLSMRSTRATNPAALSTATVPPSWSGIRDWSLGST